MTTIGVDFDNTLTRCSGDPYRPGGEKPNREMIEYVRWLKEEKHHEIIIWTARPWSQAGHIAGLCTQWGVQYNGLMCGKGGADVYIDDKAVNHFDPEWQDRVEKLADEPHIYHDKERSRTFE